MAKNKVVGIGSDISNDTGLSSSLATQSGRSLLELSADEARAFFLKSESYCNFDLPQYINFSKILSGVDKFLDGKELKECHKTDPKEVEAINHVIFNNKDGKYAWRPLELIHPVIYVSLVHKITQTDNWKLITKRFKAFSNNPQIECVSLPRESLTEQKDKAEQIHNWWQEVEQQSLELALDYEYMVQTDITDCYGSIYTHSIPWAIHGKKMVKQKKNKTNMLLVGNAIDASIRDMSYGQTNGIPQGSSLMDFIAEIVLGYADLNLSERINPLISEYHITEYHIIRYRDDYRIFVNNPQDGEKILKILTEIMVEFGMKLNTSKTKISDTIVADSFKADKLYWVRMKQSMRGLQQHLLIIHSLAMSFPNSGSLMKSLNVFHKKINKYKRLDECVTPLISILVDIAYHNPRTYAIISALLSKVIDFIDGDDQKRAVIDRVRKKFEKIPNTGHLQIWLQRLTLSLDKQMPYNEKLCKVIVGEKHPLWNVEWISAKKLKVLLDSSNIIDADKIEDLPPVITQDEVDLFQYNNQSY